MGLEKRPRNKKAEKVKHVILPVFLSYFSRVRGIQQLIENRKKNIKTVVQIVVENENPKKWSKKRKNEVQGGGRKREGSVAVAWG